MYYFGVRYYAAWLGRWTSSDPGSMTPTDVVRDFVDGVNMYQYAQNNPVKLVDGEGYKAVEPEKVEPKNEEGTNALGDAADEVVVTTPSMGDSEAERAGDNSFDYGHELNTDRKKYETDSQAVDTIVIPEELQEIHDKLYKESATYKTMYDRLNADKRVLNISFGALTSKTEGAMGEYSKSRHRIIINKNDENVVSTYVEEFSHAYQGLIYNTANLLDDKDAINKKMKDGIITPEKAQELRVQRDLETNKKGMGTGAFIEIEAKLIREQIRQEVAKTDISFTTDVSSTGGQSLQPWFNKNRKDRKTKNLISITSETQIRKFYALQTVFANYYIWNTDEGRKHQYAQDKKAVAPDALNSLTKH